MKRRISIHDLMQQNPILLWAMPLILGIAVSDVAYSLLSHFSFLFLALAIATGAGMIICHARAWKGMPFLCLELLTFFLLGIALLLHSRDGLQVSWPSESTSFHALVTAPPKEGHKAVQATLEIQDGPHSGHQIRATLMRNTKVKVQAGDVLLLNGRIETPRNQGNPGEFDYAAWLRHQGISGVIFCDSIHYRNTGGVHLTLPLRALRYRSALVSQYEHYFSGYDLAILSALTLGEKGGLTNSVREVFSETGTSHILALSGLHLGILFFFYNILLSAFSRRSRWRIAMSIPGLLLIWGYALLAGMPTSLLRSAIMFSIIQVSLWGRQDIFSLNNLALAACLILFFSPQALFDVGFQLSFLSVLGILLFVPRLPRLPYSEFFSRYKLHGIASFLYSTFTVSLCAQVMTLPLVAYYFHIVPLYGLVASYIAIPLAYPLLFFSILFFLFPPLQPLTVRILGLCLDWLYGGLEAISGWPHAALSWYPSALTVALYYICIVLLYVYLSQRHVRTLYGFTAIAAICSAVELTSYATHHLPQEFIVYNLRGTTAVHVIEAPGKSYLWTLQPTRTDSALSYIKSTFWQREKITEPRLVTMPGNYGALTAWEHVLQLNKVRIGLLYDRIDQRPDRPLSVDYLVIVRGYRQNLNDALHVFSPKTIVLDASLTDFYRRRFTAQADSLHLPLHDIRRDGALTVTAE